MIIYMSNIRTEFFIKIPQSNGTSNDKHMLKGLSAIVNNRVLFLKCKRHIFIHGNLKVLFSLI